jgi:hypothetical protein
MQQNYVYDSTTDQFVDATQYTDANGNLLPPAGFTFVQAEVSQFQNGLNNFMTTPTPLATPNFMPTPMFQPSAFAQDFTPQYDRPAEPMRFHSSRRTKVNIKETLVQSIFESVKQCTQSHGVYCDIRDEDHGYHTIRVHAKKKGDVAAVPWLVQKVISDIGMKEFSMHYLVQQNTRAKTGITIYMRVTPTEEAVKKTIAIFAQQKISARRLRMPPSRAFPDEDPDIEEEDETSSEEKPKIEKPMMKSNESRTISIMVPKKEKSESVSVLVPKTLKRQKSGRSVSVLVPKPSPKKMRKKRSISVLVPRKEELLELKFASGATKKVRVDSKATRDITKSLLM